MKKKILMIFAALALSSPMSAQSEITPDKMIETPHISAKEGAFAPTVLMPGDPLRAKFIAETFL